MFFFDQAAFSVTWDNYSSFSVFSFFVKNTVLHNPKTGYISTKVNTGIWKPKFVGYIGRI
jgi:hypothetical protein